MKDVRRWSSYVLLVLFAVWLFQWLAKIVTGSLPDALDFTSPSLLSALGIGAILAFVLARRIDYKRAWPYLTCIVIVGAAVVGALILRLAYALVPQLDVPPWLSGLLDLATPLPGDLPLPDAIGPVVGPAVPWLFFVLEVVMAALVVRRLHLYRRTDDYAPPSSFSWPPFLFALLFFTSAAVISFSAVVSLLFDGRAHLPYGLNPPPLFILPLIVAYVEVSTLLRRESRAELAA